MCTHVIPNLLGAIAGGMRPYPREHAQTPSHPGHLDWVAVTLPSQAPAGAVKGAPELGQWEGQDALVRPSSCIVKGGIQTPEDTYLPTYLPLLKERFWMARGSIHIVVDRFEQSKP